MKPDARDFAELLADLYEGAQDLACWTSALVRVRDQLGADCAMLIEVDLATLTSTMLASTEDDARLLADYSGHWRQHHPWPAALLSASELGRVISTQAFLVDTDAATPATSAQSWRPYGDLFWSLTGYFRSGPDCIAMIGVARSRGRGCHGALATTFLQSLLPHLRRARGMRQVFAQTTAASHMLDTLHAHSVGMVMLDARDRVIQVNSRFLDHSRGPRAPRVRLGQLLFDDETSQNALDAVCRWLRGVRHGEFVAPPLGRVQLGRQHALLRAIPIWERGEGSLKLPAATAAVLSFHLEPTALSLRDQLAMTYACTNAEISVAMDLVAGMAPASIAEQRKVGLSTVRTHIKRLYFKLGVKRQTELMARLGAHRA